MKMSKIINGKDFAKENENKDIEILGDGLFRVLEPVKVWMPKFGVNYFYINPHGHIHRAPWRDTEYDFYRWYNGNVFKTPEIAQKVSDITLKFKKLAYEELVDWEDFRQTKYYLHYNHNTKILDIRYHSHIQDQGKDNFKDYYKLNDLIKEVGEADVIKYYLKIGVNN